MALSEVTLSKEPSGQYAVGKYASGKYVAGKYILRVCVLGELAWAQRSLARVPQGVLE